MKGKNLVRFELYAATSDRGIVRELQQIHRRFLLINFAILLLTLGIGWVLARSFLSPVHQLSLGVKALRQREFAHRIPPLGEDELGILGLTFNQMIESLEDLASANIIQKTFFPASPLEIQGMELFGRYQPASELGGDYFDFFPVDDHRVFFIIGDVSGHGTSAGLVVAMVKGLVHFPDNEWAPDKILGLLQKVLSENLQRVKLMSCLAGIFDVTTGRLTLANAGHVFPILLRAGTARFLEVKGPLLGVLARFTDCPCRAFDLLPGDRVFLFTDGLTEAQGANGLPLGYDLLKSALPGLLQGSTRESLEKVSAWHQSLARPGPQQDDITTMVLLRKS